MLDRREVIKDAANFTGYEPRDESVTLVRQLAQLLEEQVEESRTLRGQVISFEDDLADALETLKRVRELVSDPCSDNCCRHCDGKNEGWEMVLDILDRGV